MNEYRYLGIILSKEISEKTIYTATLNKFKNRLTSAKAFGGSMHWRLWFYKIFAIPLFSHLIQFAVPSPEMCNTVDTLAYNFLVPMRSFSKEVLFALPGTYLPPPFPPTLAEYTARFPNSCNICGSWRSLRVYDSESARSQITEKLSRVAQLSPERAENIYLLSGMAGPAITTTLLLNIGALPFYNRLKHFAPNIQNVCPLCSQGTYDPDHLFQCPIVQEWWSAAEDFKEFREGIEMLQECSYHLAEPCRSLLHEVAATIHTIWTISRMVLYLKVPFGYAAAAHTFRKALKAIKPAKLHDHHERKGLQRADDLIHALQDNVSSHLIRVTPDSDSDSDSDSDYEMVFDIDDYMARNAPQQKPKKPPTLILRHRHYNLFVNSKIRKIFKFTKRKSNGSRTKQQTTTKPKPKDSASQKRHSYIAQSATPPPTTPIEAPHMTLRVFTSQ
ncbi:hypothetical protein F9K33_16575 [bacterium]|nr:MAG: hypothetical protein F9K33_16575 [bacterium]